MTNSNAGLTPADILVASGGKWFRGHAEIVELDGVRCVVCRGPFEYYEMRDVGRRAAQTLRDLGPSPSERDLVAFVNRFGPLTLFHKWIELAYSHLYVRMSRVIVGSHFDYERWRDDELKEMVEAWTTTPDLVLAVDRYDLFQFEAWCGANGVPGCRYYVQRMSERVFEKPSDSPNETALIPEPVALYGWCSAMLGQLHSQLVQSGIDRPTSIWLGSRLQDTHLGLSPRSDVLEVHAQDLLAYLAAQTVLDVEGHRPELRSCANPTCGKTFPLTDPRSHYCSKRCKETAMKRRQRQSHRTARSIAPA